MHAGAMQYFGIKDTDVPSFAIHDATNNAKYMVAKASPEDLTSFVAEFEVSCVVQLFLDRRPVSVRQAVTRANPELQ